MPLSTPRIVAVDYGHKRTGLALADPLRLFAQPHGTHPTREVLDVLRDLDARDGIETVVVGWPLLPDGTEGAATKRVAAFIERLRRALPHVEVVRWDERFTSEQAKEQIYRSGTSRKRRADKSRVDAAAAGIILQEYLDGG